MYKFATELFKNTYKEAMPLTEKHREEINLFNEELDVFTEAYLQADENNSSRVFTIRDENEKMLGYSIFFLYNPTHHKTSVHARQDVLYIEKEHRGAGLGKGFIQYCERQLKEAGAIVIQQCVPKLNDWSKLLKHMGYSELETVYMRRL